MQKASKEDRKKEEQITRRLTEVYKNDIKPFTPLSLGNEVVNKLFSQLSDTYFNSRREILVMSDCGLLWSLIKKIKYLNLYDNVEITFLCHTKRQQNFSSQLKSLFNINNKFLPYSKTNKKDFERNFNDMKFDLIVGNPPYNGGIYLNFLKKSINDLNPDHVILILPSTFLLDRKKNNTYMEIKEMLKGKLKSAKLFNGNPIFGIGLFVPCVIIHYDANYNGLCEVDYFGERFQSDIWNITKFGKSWETIVKLFMEKIKNCMDNGDVWNHRLSIEEREELSDKHYCQFPSIRGHHDYSDEKTILDDFYTLVMSDSENNKGIRNKDARDDNYIVYKFDTEQSRDNFLEYCKTYFVRFCLSLYKNNGLIGCNNMSLIPWLDFTQEWTDEKLFKRFDIDETTQNYIYTFLPDFYGIKKNE